MSLPTSRPVHPCVLSLTETRGAEFSCWARLLPGQELPCLVTAAASCLSIYSLQPTGEGDSDWKLFSEHVSAGLAGNIIFLDVLRSPSTKTDALLVGFGGHPRLTVLQVSTTEGWKLQTASLLDLTPAVQEHSYGATSVFEQDAISVMGKSGKSTEVACILGGGVAVAVTSVTYKTGRWWAEEPYLLPLKQLQQHLKHGESADQPSSSVMTTGFGDITAACFLTGFTEPVLVLLHTAPGGAVWSGRLGRKDGGAIPVYLTAMSVSTQHNRTAVLYSTEVPADAFHLTPIQEGGCLVMGANTFTFLGGDGRVQQVLATNGFAGTTCPVSILQARETGKLQANPIVKLAIQLDGSSLCWIADHVAVLSLRRGQLYVLQRTAGKKWILLPTAQTLGATGEVSHLKSLPLLSGEQNDWLGTKLFDESKATTKKSSMGLLFAGSRLGDSLLLGFRMETVSVPWDSVEQVQRMVKQEDQSMLVSDLSNLVSAEYDQILRLEEEALYAPTGQTGPDVVPFEEEEGPRKRARVEEFTVVKQLTPLDVLVNVGPLGPPCEGPLSEPPDFLIEAEEAVRIPGAKADPVLGATAHVFPAGYGSSGGLALFSVPGRDDRMIVTEQDCLHVECMFSLPTLKAVFLGQSSMLGGGVRVLRLIIPDQQEKKAELTEVDLNGWCSKEAATHGTFANAEEVLKAMLLSAGELDSDHFVLLVNTSKESYAIVTLRESEGRIEIVKEESLESEQDGLLVNVTPFVTSDSDSDGAILTFGCLWASGRASLVTLTKNGGASTYWVERTTVQEDFDAMDLEEDEEELERKKFYTDGGVVAVDVFKAPKALFHPVSGAPTLEQSEAVPDDSTHADTAQVSTGDSDKAEEALAKRLKRLKKKELFVELRKNGVTDFKEAWKKDKLIEHYLAALAERRRASPQKESTQKEKEVTSGVSSADKPARNFFEFDDDDDELYATGEREDLHSSGVAPSTTASRVDFGEDTLFLAICRKTSELEVYSILEQGHSVRLCWKALGAALGVPVLSRHSDSDAEVRLPRSHLVAAKEIRFFSCGQTSNKLQKGLSQAHGLCVVIETTNGDLSVYRCDSGGMPDAPKFVRVPLRNIDRPSREQSRHHAKLLRRRVVARDEQDQSDFAYNALHRFSGSGQSGLFAAGARPQWFVTERGRPMALAHRTRHAAPAGGKPRPVSGFCPGLTAEGGYLVLHERVGRVGSQRLTLFKDISNVFASQGLLPGSGYCVEKIPMGVTVRCIQFIDDGTPSTGNRPLYAVLVSRELQVDQSAINSDGLTPEERKRIQEEKEAEKIQRQVEADLSGFDVESEWVEEIERENCFKVDTELGGAPPVQQSVYSLWIVDAANKWMVVDSYELDEHEHGLDLKVMSLTEFGEDAASSADESEQEDAPKRLFVTVGTGLVDHNGEDVSSKGRVLLFEVTRPSGSSRLATSQVAELSLCYEKEIFHGPVTTLSCLSAEGKNRLVIGGGCDVNIEQWGSNGTLTQVGFFRATMQILDIILFKNFFLLSDAFDSMYFLVWRESDKSLTLLAKDYDPIPVYAAGLMSRGPSITFLCHDDRQNLQFFQYAPGEAAARGGNKLVCRADYHLGTQTTGFVSHFCRPSLLVHSATPTSSVAALKQQDTYFGRQDDDQRLGVHFGTTDGGVGSIVPLSEPVYWRLMALQSVMANALESDCSLSQRAWRLYRRTSRRGGCRSNDRKKSVIDGDLVLQYADLPTTEQEDLASAIGSTVTLILDNLLELRCGSMIL